MFGHYMFSYVLCMLLYRFILKSVESSETCSDIVFTQNALMWMKPLSQVMSEIQRIVKPGGWLTAVEPDYGGYIEFPSALAIKEIWITALKRAGAEPLICLMKSCS